MTNPNDPAFEPLIWKQMPLTKREYFAAMAMQALMTRYPDQPNIHAQMACAHADALIAELNKESK